MNTDLKQYCKENYELMLDTLRELCAIPAPSHFEHERAAYCKKWLENIGAKGVYIDDALNVIYPLNCDGSREITVFVAHTDTVFPDREPMPYFDDGEKIHCPGVGDDTGSVTVLLAMAKYFTENNIVPEKGIMFVCNSCEEGLGNLKGTRQLFKDYEGRIARFISFDGGALHSIADRCVGSHRYEVEVLTEGGHSWGKFGNENAIANLAGIVNKIYGIDLPKKDGAKTSFNVGEISGGTSVNTIAQNARMLCEYRSNDVDCLAYMEKKFEEIFESARSEDVRVAVKRVGERPCGIVPDEKIEDLRRVLVPIIEAASGNTACFRSSSTDCNIPLSLGVPAICIGVDNHQGSHTREEWLEKASLIPGLEIAINSGLAFSGVTK
ncbi:MAG: M20/M25/M40 family metallo-hydrolase [Oscillospiraceae bacterium]|nr:M20/M25/M40 family metallo-hydrolase [Oscillospiraceae bacterium]MBQ6697520.1 M20/M25/M40 family metallo-hydrolase [Oscillospiraceae bacterium]